MKIDVKCYANLSDPKGCNFRSTTQLRMPERAVVGDLLEQVMVTKDVVRVIYVNGRKATVGKQLARGDRVGLFPAVAGM